MRHRNLIRCRLSLESLEDRLAPACAVLFTDSQFPNGLPDQLRIIGDDKNQIVEIVDNPASSQVQVRVDCNGDGDFTDAGDHEETFSASFEDTIQVLELVLGGGNDQVTYTMTSDLSVFLRSIRVDLGAGNDEFTFQTSGGVDFANTALSFDVRGGKGADAVTAIIGGQFTDAELIFQADLAQGGDTGSLNLLGAVVNSIVDVDLDLGTGNNDYTVQLAMVINGPTSMSTCLAAI